MNALMNTHSPAENHHSILLSFVSGFNEMLKFKLLALSNQSQARVVKTVFENMLRVREEHVEASKHDDKARRYKAEVRLEQHVKQLYLKINESKPL